MNDFMRRFYTTPRRTECMQGIEPIDLRTLAPPRQPNDLLHFCNLMSEAVGQALLFANGTYAESGAEHRAAWCFWVPLLTQTGEEGELVIRTSQLLTTNWWYQLCFHGGGSLYATLSQCLLHSDMFDANGTSEQEMHVGLSTILEPHIDLPAMRFDLVTMPNRMHTLNLLPRAQFGL